MGERKKAIGKMVKFDSEKLKTAEEKALALDIAEAIKQIEIQRGNLLADAERQGRQLNSNEQKILEALNHREQELIGRARAKGLLKE